MFLAGGTNFVDHMKLGVVRPDLLVDVTRLPLDRIERREGGVVRIGAGVRNSDLAADATIRARYPVLAQALLAGASIATFGRLLIDEPPAGKAASTVPRAIQVGRQRGWASGAR